MTKKVQDEDEYPFPPAYVFDAAEEAAASLKRYRPEKTDRSSGRISGTVGNVWITTVQKIDITISGLSSGQTRVSVTSASWPATVVLDHGKNQENVDLILDTIGDILERKFPAWGQEPQNTDAAVREYHIRQELRPLEQLLAQGTITPAEFDAARDRIQRQ